MSKRPLAQWRKVHTARSPFKKRCANLRFKHLYAACDCRLREPDLLCGFMDCSMVYHRYKACEIVDIAEHIDQ